MGKRGQAANDHTPRGIRQAMADRAAFAAVTAAEALDRLESADHLLSSSRPLIQSARLADWPGDYLHYLPPLVETRSDAPLARERLGSNPDRDVLLVVADLQPEARLDMAIRALAALPYCELWIAGEGAEQRRLALAARHCEVATRVFFLGEGVELPALYAAADLVLATADQDSHGLQILEAWAQSKPVVATKTAAARQLITDDFNGRLVPPGDAAALARLVDGVLHDASGYDRLIHEGKKAFDASYRESQVIEAWSKWMDIPVGSRPQLPAWMHRAQAGEDQMVDNLRALNEASVPIAVGSDGGNIGSMHGPAFQRELTLLSKAGLTTMQVLVAATRTGAEAIGRLDDLGTLEQGKFGDLVILDADPLDSVENLDRVVAVVVRGNYLAVEQLDAIQD